MPLIVTPGLLNRRSELYQQLASLLGAGVAMLEALEMLRRSPPSGSFRPPLTRVIARINEGYTLGESLAFQGDWLPPFDLALLKAGEESGRLPECCRLLAGYYDERAKLARRVIGDLAYPLFLAHFALLVFPLSDLTALVQSFNPIAFVAAKLKFLLPAYALVLFVIVAGQGQRSEPWRAMVERLLNLIPMVGRARKDLALARLSAALEALINAGVSILEAWNLSADASGSPALRRAVQRWRHRLEAGQTPGEILGNTAEFPETFANLYLTGEVSGKLDETLGHLHRLYQEEGSRRMHLVAQWVPRLVYLAILLGVAWFIVSFWMGYFRGIADALNF
jgi:type II secretory pathway component PulF